MNDLRLAALREELRYFAACRGLASRTTGASVEDGLRVIFTSGEESEEVFFALAPKDGDYLSLSLVLVVDEEFFRSNIESILGVTSRYDVCASPSRDESLGEGEVYLHLSLRLFLVPLTRAAFGLGVDNLRAAKDALAAAFGGEDE